MMPVARVSFCHQRYQAYDIVGQYSVRGAVVAKKGRRTYSPELLSVVEVNIVFGDLGKDIRVGLSLIQGSSRGVSARTSISCAFSRFAIRDLGVVALTLPP